MSTITPTEACARLAEMMGWTLVSKKSCSVYQIYIEWRDERGSMHWYGVSMGLHVGTFNPLTDANQAIECLEAWLNGDKYRSAQTHSDSTGHQIELEGKEWEDMAFATNPSHNYAIAEALLSAEAGESITIGGE